MSEFKNGEGNWKEAYYHTYGVGEKESTNTEDHITESVGNSALQMCCDNASTETEIAIEESDGQREKREKASYWGW